MHLISFGKLTARVFLQPRNKDIMSMSHFLIADDYKTFITASRMSYAASTQSQLSNCVQGLLVRKFLPEFTAAANSFKDKGTHTKLGKSQQGLLADGLKAIMNPVDPQQSPANGVKVGGCSIFSCHDPILF